MPNSGVAPIDPSSLVGQTRNSVGATQYVELVPAVPGFGDFQYFSDGEVSAFLLAGRDSIVRATGFALLQLAHSSASTGVAVRADDLSVDNSKRGSTLLDIAKSYFAQADAEDLAAANADSYFAVVTPVKPGYAAYPAASAPFGLTESPQYPGLWS